jgi:hypothetical protein
MADTYCWKLTATRELAGSEKVLRFVELPASVGKMEGLRDAMLDFQRDMGSDWKVTHLALSPEYYSMRLIVLANEKAFFERAFQMTETDFYRLGKQRAFIKQDEYTFDDLPPMDAKQTAEFNAGFDEAKNEQKLATRTLIVLCALTVAACFFFWWIQ